MDYKQTLLEEIKRLNRLNEKYEEMIMAGNYEDEPKLIINNVLAMCEIAHKLKI